MTRILTVASQKGGVGKTTTTLNLSYSLSRFGDRVLLIDADPQGGMSIASNVRRKSRLGLVQLLRDSDRIGELVVPTRDRTMAVLGSGIDAPSDALFLEQAAREGRLSSLIQHLANGYQYVVADAPAGVGSIVSALLAASDGVVIAMRCQAIMLHSLPLFLRLVQDVRRESNPRLQIEGALITMWNASSAVEEKLRSEFVGKFPPEVLFRTMIPSDEAFEVASMRGVPVSMMPKGRDAARAYLDLAMELKERSREGGSDDDVEGLF